MMTEIFLDILVFFVPPDAVVGMRENGEVAEASEKVGADGEGTEIARVQEVFRLDDVGVARERVREKRVGVVESFVADVEEGVAGGARRNENVALLVSAKERDHLF